MSKQKIAGNVPSNNCMCLNQREAMGSYIGLFGKYFDKVGNWMTNVEVSNMVNTAYVYSKVNKITSCSSCARGTCVSVDDKWDFGPADPVWEHSFLNQKKPDFIRVEASKFERRLCDKSMIFSLKTEKYDRVVGEFCPGKKLLLATDWTHDDTKTDFITEMLTTMSKMGLITPRGVKAVKPTITLGADPEVEYVDQDTHQVIHVGDSGIQDRLPMGGPGSEGRIGLDGSKQQRELRPKPASTPEGLVANIGKLIEAALDEQWSLKGNTYPLGGHIHVGGITESRGFVILLDHYLAPLSVLNATARTNSPYGKPGDVRKQDWGIEYRTPPAGWLASKKLATITFKIVKLAAEKHYSGDDIEITDTIHDDLESLGLSTEEVNDFFSEIATFKTQGLPEDLKTAWGYKVNPTFTLEFRDNWNAEVKVFVDKMAKELAVKENITGRVVLYGLDASRGNVFSLVMAHMNGIDMPENYGFMPPLKTGAGVNHVGIPAAIRGNVNEAKRMSDVVLEVIKRTINPPKPKRKKSVGAESTSEIQYVPPSWTFEPSPLGFRSTPTWGSATTRSEE